MIFYKTSELEDPYYDLWHSPEWLFPFENKEKLIFPKILTVEPVNICQNKCLYCCMRLMRRKTGFMSMGIMKRIAEEAALYDGWIRFGGFGEPLMNKDIVEFVRLCKEKKLRASIFTNATYLTEDMMRSFCELGLDEIKFSSAGISEMEHNEVRKNSDWDKDLCQKIVMAHGIKKEMNSKRPYLTLCTVVFDFDRSDFQLHVQGYVKRFLSYADKIDIDLIDLSRVKDLEGLRPYYAKTTIKQIYKPCVTLYHKMLVHWNGDVFICDVAYNLDRTYYCGNLYGDATLYDMYHSPKANKIRELTESLQHEKLPLCKDCFQNTYKYEGLKEEFKKSCQGRRS